MTSYLVLGGARSGKTRRALALAETISHAHTNKGQGKVYVATAQAMDDEMRERIARHRQERDASWTTLEAPLDLADALLSCSHARKLAARAELSCSHARVHEAQAESSFSHGSGLAAQAESSFSHGSGLAAQAEPGAPGLAARAGDAPGETSVVVVDCLTIWLANLMHAGRDVADASEALRGAIKQAEGRFDVVIVSNEVGLSIVPENALARRFRDAQGMLNQDVAAIVDVVEFVAAGLPMRLKGEAAS